eukprot:524307-Hanusia_phi.AAC.3
MRFLDVIVGTRVVRLVILLILICAPADGDVQEENSSMKQSREFKALPAIFGSLARPVLQTWTSIENIEVTEQVYIESSLLNLLTSSEGFLARDQMLSQPGDTGNDIRIYRHGIEDPNSTVFQEIREADSTTECRRVGNGLTNRAGMVTEPDDIVKLEEEVRALQSKIRMQKVLISNSSNVSAAAKNIPGEFRWIENWEMHGEKPTNASNETLGLWIWCKNSSNFAKIHWQNGTLIGAPAINASQTFQTVKGCVSVVSPAWMEVDESAGEDTKKEEKEEEEEMQEIRSYMSCKTLKNLIRAEQEKELGRAIHDIRAPDLQGIQVLWAGTRSTGRCGGPVYSSSNNTDFPDPQASDWITWTLTGPVALGASKLVNPGTCQQLENFLCYVREHLSNKTPQKRLGVVDRDSLSRLSRASEELQLYRLHPLAQDNGLALVIGLQVHDVASAMGSICEF